MASIISLMVVLYVARIVACIPTEPDIEPENYRLVFKNPEGCIRSECTTFIAIDINSGDSSFLDIYLEGQANGYVAVGFSNTPNVFSADVVACVRNPYSGSIQSVDAWNLPSPFEITLIDPTGKSQNIVQFSATFDNTRLRCSVAKSISGTDVSEGFDLPLDVEEGLYVLTGHRPGNLFSLIYLGFGLWRSYSEKPIILVPVDPIEAIVTNTAPSILDEGSDFQVCVSLSSEPTNPVEVIIETLESSPVTAEDGIDYSSVNATLVFQPPLLEEQCVTISIFEDRIIEQMEFFTVRVTTTESAISLNGTTQFVPLISDTTVAVLGFAQTSYAGTEVGYPRICVVLVNTTIEDPDFTSTVTLTGVDLPETVQDDFAVQPTFSFSDLTFSSTTLPRGRCFYPHFINNDYVEDMKSYTLSITPETPNTIISPGFKTTILTVKDDDGVTMSVRSTDTFVSITQGITSVEVCVTLDDVQEGLFRSVPVNLTILIPGSANDAYEDEQWEIPSTTVVGETVCQSVNFFGDLFTQNYEFFYIQLEPGNSNDVFTGNASVKVKILDDGDIVCEDDEFACVPENRCLPMSYVCDGIPDCLFGSSIQLDEINCKTGCVDGDLRPLLGGNSDSEGIVEVCVSGQFRTLTLVRSGEFLSVREATVICKQLGQGTAGFSFLGRAEFGFEVATANSNDTAFLHCQGTENRVAECDLSIGVFGNHQAGVRCIDATPCIDGSVRLADGPDEREGRVEVCFQNTWGVVYDFDWGAMDAAVVCRELGYDFNGAIPIIPALYGDLDSVHPVARIDPICRAENRNFSNCFSPNIQQIIKKDQFQDQLYDSVSNDFKIRDIVGVRCEAYSNENCSHLDVRLVFRDNVIGSSGLMEICNDDGVWSPLVWSRLVFIDYFKLIKYLDRSKVMCRQLGFGGVGFYDVWKVPNNFFSIDTPPYSPLLPCEGYEDTLMECLPDNSSSVSSASLNVDDFFQITVNCYARQRLFSYPPSLDGVYEIDLGRPANIWCRWDTRISPPVRILAIKPDTIRWKRDHGVAPPARRLFYSDSVKPADTGVYQCFTYTGVYSQNLTIIVRGPEGVDESAFIRFTVPAIEHLNAKSGTNSTVIQEFLIQIEETILSIISDNSPGFQTVGCYFLPQGVFEVERELDRVECNITQYQRSEEPVVPVTQIAQQAVFALEYAIGVVVFGDSSANGFCNSEVTTSGEQVFLWPEARGKTTVSIPCPTDTSVTVTRMCGELGQWEEPDVEPCHSE